MNWHERIDRAEKRGKFTLEDRELAQSWPDCACGEQDSQIPRDVVGEPRDEHMSRLGFDFSHAVASNEFIDARHVLAAIEKRANEIVRDMYYES